jgi:short-subunit dehydrogenase
MDAEAVGRLAEHSVQALGGIDVWINNAGTGVFGPFQAAEIALHRRAVEVNLLGTMNGAYAVLEVLLLQKSGVLINNISLGGWASAPFAAAYTASKFGLRGVTASLRQELAHPAGIHVCAVFPAMIDTPGFVHGANVSGRKLDPGPFLYQPEDVAATFLTLVHHPRDEVSVGWPARAGQLLYEVARGPTERATATIFRALLSSARPAARTTGSIVAASPAGTATSGGWLARKGIPPAGEVSRLALAGGAAILLIGLTSLIVRSARARPR